MVVELVGYLKKDSIVREAFPDGKVPLSSPFPDKGKGREDEEVELYRVDMDKLAPAQMREILNWFGKQDFLQNQSEQDILARLRKEGFRIQKKHFSSVPIDMRLFI